MELFCGIARNACAFRFTRVDEREKLRHVEVELVNHRFARKTLWQLSNWE